MIIDILFYAPFYEGTSFKILVNKEEIGGGYWGVVEGKEFIAITINIGGSKESFRIPFVKYRKRAVEKAIIDKIKIRYG